MDVIFKFVSQEKSNEETSVEWKWKWKLTRSVKGESKTDPIERILNWTGMQIEN